MFFTCRWLVAPSSGGCDGGGQGAFVGGASEEGNIVGETTAGEPEPG